MTQFHFPPRSGRGAVLGFTWGQIAWSVAGVGCGVVGLNLFATGHLWVAAAAVAAAGVLLTVGLLRLRGRRATEWLPVIVGALVQRAAAQDRYRGGVFAPGAVTDHVDLPGPAAGYVWLTATAADGKGEVGLLHHRRERTITAALPCTGANFLLAGPPAQARRLTDWAQVLNILGTEYADAGLVAWSLCNRLVPDVANRAQRFLTGAAVDTESAAYRSLAQLTAAAGPGMRRHDTFLAVVFDIARLSAEIDDAGGTDEAIATVVLDRLTGIAATVAEAGVTTHGWLSPREYAAVLRTQYDPDDQEAVDLHDPTAGGGGAAVGVSPRLAGPVAAQTVGWGTYRHDSGFSRTLWVAQMPRELVAGTWLNPLYTSASARRTVTLTAQPVPAALAQLAARRERVARAGDEVTKRKLRLVRTARDVEEARAVEQTDREQAAGHVRYRYTLLVTVTSATQADLHRDVRAVKRLLARAGCETLTLYGEQDQAFTAGALPLARGLKPMRGWWA